MIACTKFKTISSCFQNGTNKERVRWSGFHLRNWRQAYAKTHWHWWKKNKNQLCTTPVCIKPDLNYEGKASKCHYCNNICCNCENCKKFRAFFQIRTALINTGKVNHWDYLDARMERQVHLTSKMVQTDRQMRKIMETLYERAKIDNPQLPTSMDQLKGQALRSKLRKIAVRMMEGPMIKSDEKLNEMADELTNEVVEHFLKQQGIIKPRTTELMRWVTRSYHKKKRRRAKRDWRGEWCYSQIWL